MKQDTQSMQLLSAIAQSIYDKKGFNILVLDVRGLSSLSDYVILAEGNIDRHVKALSNNVKKSLDEMGEKPLFIEGERDGDWVVIDSGDVMVHLLTPDYREKYALESLWRPAKVVDVKIDTKHPQKAEEDYA